MGVAHGDGLVRVHAERAGSPFAAALAISARARRAPPVLSAPASGHERASASTLVAVRTRPVSPARRPASHSASQVQAAYMA